MSHRQGDLDGDAARSRLYAVMRADGPLEERIESALDVGTEYLGVESGFVTEIDRGSGEWETVVSTDGEGGTAPAGTELDLTSAYCKRTIREQGTVAIENAPEQGWADDPAFEETGIHCYHGASVVVGGEVYGSVCFASLDPRAEAFTEAERTFVELIARMVGFGIERGRRESELDRREAEIREREELYRSVVDASFDAVFRLDRSGRFLYASRTVETLLGYAPDELVDEHFSLVIPDGDAAAVADELFRATLDGETVEKPYLPLETRDGDRIYADIRATPVYDTGATGMTGLEPGAPGASDTPRTDGAGTDRLAWPDRGPENVVAVQGMARDATDRKRREQLISVLNRVLRHNLRNDMNVVRGYAEVLSEQLEGDPAEYADRIVATADRLTELSATARKLQQHLDEGVDPEPADIAPVVREAASAVGERYPAADVTVDCPDSAVVRGAPRLEAALWELLDNAAGHAGDSPDVEVTVEARDGRVAVSVADDGPGLPETERRALTDGEETPLDHGSGLGLSLVYWAVTSLDGAVDVSVDNGTTVTLSLPAA